MSTELEAAIRANPEAAKAIIAKLEAEPQWDADTWFLDLTKNIESKPSPKFPHRRLHNGLINGERVTLFEQDLKTGGVWCRYRFVWSVLEEHFSPNYSEVQAKLKHLLEEYLGWRVETTVEDQVLGRIQLEEYLGWRVETTETK